MWDCEHCEQEVEDKYDYCPNCEESGCIAGDHKCKKIELIWLYWNPNPTPFGE